MFSIGSLYVVKTWDRDAEARQRRVSRTAASEADLSSRPRVVIEPWDR